MFELVTLVRATAVYTSEFEEVVDEFRSAGEAAVYSEFYSLALHDIPAFFALLERLRAGGDPRPEIVPTDSYFMISGNRIAGEISVRHRLTGSLLRHGGHIGYQVRPSMRRRGIATRALGLALARLDEIGVSIALLTCNDSNAASARVIEANGGVRIDPALELERRYDVPTSANASLTGAVSWDADAENARRAKATGARPTSADTP